MKTLPKLPEVVRDFVARVQAKDDARLVLLSFGSMPVSTRLVVKIALKLIEECVRKVCVIAVVAKHRQARARFLPTNTLQEPVNPSIYRTDYCFEVEAPEELFCMKLSSSLSGIAQGLPSFCACCSMAEQDQRLRERVERSIEEKRLLVIHEAPFSRLFPLMDCVICHGGLSTVVEAMKSGVPTIVSGQDIFC